MKKDIKRIMRFAVPREHYQAEALIVWCFDDRFSRIGKNLREALIKLRGFKHVDVIQVAGGAKDLNSSNSNPGQEFILGQIEKSLQLHNPPEIILMLHEDCGAYAKNFPSSEEAKDFLKRELEKAEAVVRERLEPHGKTNIKITKCIADFEGILQV